MNEIITITRDKAMINVTILITILGTKFNFGCT